MKVKISAFWQAVLLIILAWMIFNWAFPPFMPRSLMISYMIIIILGVLLYFSSAEQRWAEFKAPIIATLRDDNKHILRLALLMTIPLVLGYTVYNAVKPSYETPMELRQVHPAPPATFKAYNKSYDMETLENPLRLTVLQQLKEEPEQAWQTYRKTVLAGSTVFYQQCFYCHGDLLQGKGHFAEGFNPRPTNFQDVGTIAQLQESYLFWRITTGGPGLPNGGMPWKSAMPVWQEMLTEQEVWQVITFLFDYVEQVPRIWDQDISRAVTGMKDTITSSRSSMSSEQLYQFRCAVCHGENGAGDGPAAEFLSPRPRDFTQGLLKFKTSAGALPPRDQDLFNIIKHGLTATSMPGWASLLTDTQIKDLIPIIKQFDTSATWAPENAADEDFDDNDRYLKQDYNIITEQEPINGQIPYSAESIAKGKEVFKENCKKCHGVMGRGDITSGEFMEDDWGERTWARDLTKPWYWRFTEAGSSNDGANRDKTIRNIYTRLSVGIPGTPMPAHRSVEEGEEDSVTQEDRWHVANYTWSLRANKTPPPGKRTIIKAMEVTNELPSSVEDKIWQQALATSFRLVPNIIKEPRLFTQLNDTITVRSLYNDSEIAFLLEINDHTDSRPGGPVTKYFPDGINETMFADAVAIQFPKQNAYATAPVDKPLYRHGDKDHHTTIWYWNAGSVKPANPARGVLLDARGPDKKLKTRTSNKNLVTSGVWQNGRLRVMMKRPRHNNDDSKDINFPEAQFIPVSFANWDGNNGEVGSKHTLTTWYWLLLPPDTNYSLVYGAPLAAIIVVLLAGIVLVRIQRRKS